MSVAHKSYMFQRTLRGLVAWYPMRLGTGTTLKDYSASANTGTLTNGPTWTWDDGWCLAFSSGSSQYVAPGSTLVDVTTTFTIATWFYFTTGSRANPLVGLFATGNARLRVDTSDTLNWAFFDGDTDAYLNSTGLSTSTWYHGAVVRDTSSGMLLYLDGSLVDSNAETGNPSASAGSDALGNFSVNYLDGRLDDVRIYNRALSAEEIAYLAAGKRAA